MSAALCNGPGAVYERGYIPDGDCDCDGNQLDECGVCGGSGIPDGDCDCDGNQLDECGVCGGSGIGVVTVTGSMSVVYVAVQVFQTATVTATATSSMYVEVGIPEGDCCSG